MSTHEREPYDVLIVGGGPGGLSAALALGRARKRVLLCDGGPRRNALAEHLHNFVTRDGTPPVEFRALGRSELARYPSVTARDVRVRSIGGTRGAFEVALEGESVRARRILLCTGMIDELLPLPGFRELWARSIFQCPYCHGFEVQDRVWGFMPKARDAAHAVPFALQARGWTPRVVLFTAGAFELDAAQEAQLARAKIRVVTEPVARLREGASGLEAVELASGEAVPCDVLFAHPPQRQVELVTSLGLALDDDGFVQVDPIRRETSVAGIYAAGDLTTRMQGAVLAAAAAVHAAAMINVELSMELALA